MLSGEENVDWPEKLRARKAASIVIAALANLFGRSSDLMSTFDLHTSSRSTIQAAHMLIVLSDCLSRMYAVFHK